MHLSELWAIYSTCSCSFTLLSVMQTARFLSLRLNCVGTFNYCAKSLCSSLSTCFMPRFDCIFVYFRYNHILFVASEGDYYESQLLCVDRLTDFSCTVLCTLLRTYIRANWCTRVLRTCSFYLQQSFSWFASLRFESNQVTQNLRRFISVLITQYW